MADTDGNYVTPDAYRENYRRSMSIEHRVAERVLVTYGRERASRTGEVFTEPEVFVVTRHKWWPQCIEVARYLVATGRVDVADDYVLAAYRLCDAQCRKLYPRELASPKTMERYGRAPRKQPVRTADDGAAVVADVYRLEDMARARGPARAIEIAWASLSESTRMIVTAIRQGQPIPQGVTRHAGAATAVAILRGWLSA